jgi:hypothetical protein
MFNDYSYILTTLFPPIISIVSVVLIIWSSFRLKKIFLGKAPYLILVGGILFAIPFEVRIMILYSLPYRVLYEIGFYSDTPFGIPSYGELNFLTPFVKALPPFIMSIGLWFLSESEKNV